MTRGRGEAGTRGFCVPFLPVSPSPRLPVAPFPRVFASARPRVGCSIALLLLLATSCRRTPQVFPHAPVILISIDTLRADHLPVYGYKNVETPNLDALARESLVFDNAVAQVPLTLPSHATILTGLLPFQHGVRDNVGYRLAKERVTLASFLHVRGYATGAAVSAFVLDHGSGIGEGFDFYQDGIESRDAAEALGRVQRSGGETEALLEGWLERQRSDAPVFAFLHLYEPHTPYEPPEPFKSAYASRPYDGEIAAADAIVGRFVAYLKKRGLYDRALVVLLSDHGEGLGDHGEDEHGILLYREETRVPLFVRLPSARLAGRRVSTAVELADVFPTIAQALGEKPPPTIAGASLLDAAAGRVSARKIYSETLYPRYHFGWSDLASLTDDRYQYIHAPRSELYDWTADPAEKRDLAPSLPPAFRSMRVAIERMDRPMQQPGASDPETVRKLASLGYLGGASPAANRSDLPDPKDRLSTIDRLKEASRLVEEHKDDDAVALLQRIARENPLMLDAWETLARVLRRAGRIDEAIGALGEADRLSPGTPQVMLGLADMYRENGDLDRAEKLARAAAAAGGGDVDEELASIALARGDLAGARTLAQAMLARNETARAPLLILARVEEKRGDFAGALRELDRAVEVGRRWNQPPFLNLQAERADALARLGREREAEQAFRAEVASFPENLDAWSRLALLYASGGRTDDFRKLLEEMTTRVPSRRAFATAVKVCQIVGDREGARRWARR